MLWLTMHRTGRHNQSEQTIERALIFCFVLVVTTNVLWFFSGNLQQLGQHIVSQLHSSLFQLQ